MTRIVGLLSFLFPRRLLGFLVVFTALAVAIACGNHGSPTAPSSTTGSGGAGVGPTSTVVGALDDDDDSDDVDSDDAEVTPGRPLNVKKGSLGVLQTLGVDVRAPGIVSSGEAALIPHVLLGDHHEPSTPPIVALIFPHYQPGTRFRVEPLSSAQAALALVGCLINARNLPQHGVPEIARLAKEVQACRMGYGNFEQAEEWMSSLVASNLTTLERPPAVRQTTPPEDQSLATLSPRQKLR